MDTARIPPAQLDLPAMLDAYVAAVRRVLGADLVGVHLPGSVAAGAFAFGRSDVDLTVLHGPDLYDNRRNHHQRMHGALLRGHPLAAVLDATHVPLRLVGTADDGSLPSVRGLFHPRAAAVGPVHWHLLRPASVPLWGPPIAEVVLAVAQEIPVAALRENVPVLRGRMPRCVLGGTFATVFGVFALCRALHALETGEPVPELVAAEWALPRLDPARPGGRWWHGRRRATAAGTTAGVTGW